MAEEPTSRDARLVLTVATKDHDLDSGVQQLNPILRQILEARDAPWKDPDWTRANFGRLTFSQTG